MQFDLMISSENLTRPKRIDILDEIAEKMSRETGGNPRDAIITLIAAACSMARRNNPEMASGALVAALSDIIVQVEAKNLHRTLGLNSETSLSEDSR